MSPAAADDSTVPKDSWFKYGSLDLGNSNPVSDGIPDDTESQFDSLTARGSPGEEPGIPEKG